MVHQYSSGPFSVAGVIISLEREDYRYVNDLVEACVLVCMSYLGFYVDKALPLPLLHPWASPLPLLHPWASPLPLLYP